MKETGRALPQVRKSWSWILTVLPGRGQPWAQQAQESLWRKSGGLKPRGSVRKGVFDEIKARGSHREWVGESTVCSKDGHKIEEEAGLGEMGWPVLAGLQTVAVGPGSGPCEAEKCR